MKNILAILVIILSLSTITLLILYRTLKHNTILISQKVAQTIVNKQKPINAITDQESFLKFLSDSREWAFDYIENVQNGLQEFINSVEPDLKYFDKYGEIGSAYPHYDAMQRISTAYKQLKTLLPEVKNEN